THQVALIQFPLSTSMRVRHVELVSLTTTKLMSILITETGVVEQRVVDLPVEITQDDLNLLANAISAAVVGKDLVSAQTALEVLDEGLEPALAEVARVLAASLGEQIES